MATQNVVTKEKMNQAKLTSLIDKLKAKQQEIQSRKSPVEVAREKFEEQWTQTEETRRANFNVYLSNLRKIVQLEHGIIESARGFIPDEVLTQLQNGYASIRSSDNLMQLNGIYHKNRDNVKLRQVIKLLNAVYRYNRNLLSNNHTHPETYLAKSRIKHSTSCPYCGEVAKQILTSMESTKMVALP